VDAFTGGTGLPDHLVVQSYRSTHIPTPRYGSKVAAVGRVGRFAATGYGADGNVVVVVGRVVVGIDATGIAPGSVVAFGSKVVTGKALTVVAGAVAATVATVVAAVVAGARVVLTRVVDDLRRFVVVDLVGFAGFEGFFGFLGDFFRTVVRTTFFEGGAGLAT
jgi:hypothetical protein